MTKVRTVMAIILGSMCSAPYAQDAFEVDENDPFLFYGDEETFELATGTAKPLHLAPSVATVITAKDIKEMGAKNLSEVLEYVPGLHVSISWNRHNKIFSTRGIHTDNDPQMLFLINGHAYDDLYTGGRPETFRMAVANISRIEIIRGPGSAVFGADALSGVINVITKDADELAGSTAGARSGSFDTNDVWLQHGGKYMDWDLAFSFEYSKSDGDDERIITSDLQTVWDGLFSTSASFAPGPSNTQYEQLNTSITLSHEEWKVWFNNWKNMGAGVGPGVAQALDPYGYQDIVQYTLGINYNNEEIVEHLGLEAKLTYNVSDQQPFFRLFGPGAVLPIGDDGNAFTSGGGIVLFTDGVHGNPGIDTDQAVMEAAFNYDRLKSHLIRFAIGAAHEKLVPKSTQNFGPGVIDGTVSPIDGTLTDVTGTSSIFMPTVSRNVKYLSFQDEWKFAPDWELTAGVRYDDYSDFGNTTNPRLALVWATDYNLTTKFLYGRAFRAPSFAELYAINNPVTLGNPNLEPEIIDVAEVVFDYKPTFELHTVVNLYRYDLDGLIDYDTHPTLAGAKLSQNVNNQDGYGLEANIVWDASNELQVLSSIAWQKSEDSNTGETVHDAPGHQVSLGARYKVTQSCKITPQANWVADRVREQGDARDKVPDYTIVDVTMRCGIGTLPLELAASVRNAFDEDAYEPSPYNADLGQAAIPNDYPLEGRSFYIEASYQFGK